MIFFLTRGNKIVRHHCHIKNRQILPIHGLSASSEIQFVCAEKIELIKIKYLHS